MNSKPSNLRKKIIEIASELGFDLCGFTSKTNFENDYRHFKEWIESGLNADMQYLEKHLKLRKTPELIFPELESFIVVLKNYYSKNNLKNKNYKVAKYALGEDYHKLIKRDLKILIRKLQEENKNLKSRIFVDTAPVFERSIALSAGLGFIGKNRCFINEKIGSYTFIGIVAVNINIEDNSQAVYNTNKCGSCELCIQSCPTKALSDKGLDANRCIAYHTIENKSEIPEQIKSKITNQIFGCDICMDVCPINKNAVEHNDKNLQIKEEVKNITLERVMAMSEIDFNNAFKNSPLKRAGRDKIISNIKVVEKNML